MPKPKAVRRGNPASLGEHKERSLKTTREQLELALARILEGKPRWIKPGRAASALSVAKEAQIDRSTLYRYHADFLDKLKRATNATADRLLDSKRGELSRAQDKAREYRNMAEDLQSELEALARQNYALSHRLQELEEMIQARDAVIADLQERTRDMRNVVKLQRTAR
jgi:septal ring factor EnvC (AmiA/AmiB activator)